MKSSREAHEPYQMKLIPQSFKL